MSKKEKKYNQFIKKLIAKSNECRVGRGPKYFLECVDGVWYAVGISPTLPSSDDRRLNFFKYQIVIGYAPEVGDVSNMRISPLMRMGDLLTVLVDPRHELAQNNGFDQAPFEWMKIVESERDVFMDNGYICMEWFVR